MHMNAVPKETHAHKLECIAGGGGGGGGSAM